MYVCIYDCCIVARGLYCVIYETSFSEYVHKKKINKGKNMNEKIKTKIIIIIITVFIGNIFIRVLHLPVEPRSRGCPECLVNNIISKQLYKIVRQS